MLEKNMVYKWLEAIVGKKTKEGGKNVRTAGN